MSNECSSKLSYSRASGFILLGLFLFSFASLAVHAAPSQHGFGLSKPVDFEDREMLGTCQYPNEETVVYENFFEDDFQHEFEERSHPERVTVKQGELVLNGSASAFNLPLWRVNVPQQAASDPSTQSICLSTKKLTNWEKVGFEMVLADSDGELLSVAYARKAKIQNSPAPWDKMAKKSECWRKNSGQTFFLQKTESCVKNTSMTCCKNHLPESSSPQSRTWVQDVLCFAQNTGVAWLTRKGNPREKKEAATQTEEVITMATRPSSGRGLHLRFLWQSNSGRTARNQERLSLTIDDLRIHACVNPGTSSTEIALYSADDPRSTLQLKSLSKGSGAGFILGLLTLGLDYVSGGQGSLVLNVMLSSVFLTSSMWLYLCYRLKKRRLARLNGGCLPVHAAAEHRSSCCPFGGPVSNPSIVQGHPTTAQPPLLYNDSSDVLNKKQHQKVGSYENFDENIGFSGSNPSLVDVGCSTSPPLSPSLASGNPTSTQPEGSSAVIPEVPSNASLEPKKDSRKDLLEHIQAHLADDNDDSAWRIASMDEVQLQTRIDEGHYGEVFRGRWRGTEVAVKRIKTPAAWALSAEERKERKIQSVFEFQAGTREEAENGASDSLGHHHSSGSSTGSAEEEERERLAESFARELSLLKRLRSNRIVLFMGACLGPPDLCIVTEYLPKGSLHDLLHRKKKLPKGRRLVLMIKDIAEGCAFLHAQRIIHRDLKSSNLLLDENYRVKVADFGLSRICPGSVEALPTKSWAGTVAYMAPEILRGESGCTESSDCYSFGVVLWEMITGRVPWKGLEHWQIMQRVGSSEEELPLPDANSCNQILIDIMIDCLSRDSSKRPSFTTILGLLEEFPLETSSS